MKNNSKQFLFILAGFLLISSYIWVRYLRERLPRNIPFEPTIFNIFLLLFICLTYVLVIKNLAKPNNKLLIKLYSKFPRIHYYAYVYVKFIFDSLYALDNSIKFNPFLNLYYMKLMYNLILLFDKYINYTRAKILIKLFLFFPQTILLFCFFIDIFIFKKLYYFYFAIPLTFFSILFIYMIYSFKQYKTERLTFLDTKYQKLYTNFTYNFTYYYKDFWDLKEFIEMQAFEFMFENKTYTYEPLCHPRAYNSYRKEYNISNSIALSKENLKDIEKDFYIFMPILIYLELFLEYYYALTVKPNKLKIIKIVMNCAFLGCWLYILITTLYALTIEQMLWITYIIPQDFEVTSYDELININNEDE